MQGSWLNHQLLYAVMAGAKKMDFDDRMNNFDNDFAKARKAGVIMGIISLSVSAGLLGFGIWVIVKILQYLGIIG